jgi:hypothetical protein
VDFALFKNMSLKLLTNVFTLSLVKFVLGSDKHKYRTEINKQMLAESEKDYKRTLDKTQRKYRQNLCRRLKNMRTNDPKEFWKILNQGKRKTQSNISLQKLFEFFKNLNTAPSDDIGADLPSPLFL